VDDVRRELIDGVVNLMAAPNYEHADVSRNISWRLEQAVRNNNDNCKVYYAPLDVCLSKNGETEDDEIYTVVQPDILVVCDRLKLRNGKCYGAPDMIVEILSPSNRKKDLVTKFALYEQVGVREYWIASHKSKTIVAYILQDNGEYDDGEEYICGEQIPVHVFDGYLIDVNEVFQ
jgi:Uma2 family endonuclease